jgi:hypothetical protein
MIFIRIVDSLKYKSHVKWPKLMYPSINAINISKIKFDFYLPENFKIQLSWLSILPIILIHSKALRFLSNRDFKNSFLYSKALLLNS